MKRKGRTHKPDAWMPLFIADYLADTGRLTTEGHGAYMLLIMEYWRTGGPLADDDAELAAVCRMPVERWTELRRTLAKFFVVGDGVWRHGRIDDELKIAWANHEAAQKRSAAANSSKAPSRSRQGAVDVTPEAPSSPSPSPVVVDDGDDAGAPLAERVIRACGADPSKQAGWQLAAAEVARWVGRGCDPELDVLPAVRAVMVARRNRGPPNGPGYFTNAVLEARERRLSPLPTVNAGTSDARNSSQRDHDNRSAARAAVFGVLHDATLRDAGPGDG